jgi:hypothetical protein
MVDAPALGPGEALHGWGMASGGPSGRLVQGWVLGFNAVIEDINLDIVIQVAPPGTSAGDSGMLWKNASDHAVAIHIGGDATNNSTMSGAMLASRVVNRFGVKLLEA